MIPQSEVMAARARLIKKWRKMGLRHPQWDNPKEKVKIKIIDVPELLLSIGLVYKDYDLIKQCYITGRKIGDYKTAKEFIQSVEFEYNIENRPNEKTEGFYAKNLFALGGTPLGVVISPGNIKSCYTLDDLKELGMY